MATGSAIESRPRHAPTSMSQFRQLAVAVVLLGCVISALVGAEKRTHDVHVRVPEGARARFLCMPNISELDSVTGSVYYEWFRQVKDRKQPIFSKSGSTWDRKLEQRLDTRVMYIKSMDSSLEGRYKCRVMCPVEWSRTKDYTTGAHDFHRNRVRAGVRYKRCKRDVLNIRQLSFRITVTMDPALPPPTAVRCEWSENSSSPAPRGAVKKVRDYCTCSSGDSYIRGCGTHVKVQRRRHLDGDWIDVTEVDMYLPFDQKTHSRIGTNSQVLMLPISQLVTASEGFYRCVFYDIERHSVVSCATKSLARGRAVSGTTSGRAMRPTGKSGKEHENESSDEPTQGEHGGTAADSSGEDGQESDKKTGWTNMFDSMKTFFSEPRHLYILGSIIAIALSVVICVYMVVKWCRTEPPVAIEPEQSVWIDARASQPPSVSDLEARDLQ